MAAQSRWFDRDGYTPPGFGCSPPRCKACLAPLCDRRSLRLTVAAAQSRIAHALLIQFEFIHHKPVMMHAFHDDWGRARDPARSRKNGENAERTSPIRRFNDLTFQRITRRQPVLELG